MRSRRKLFFPRLLPSPLAAWFICWLSLPALLFTAPVPTNKPAHYPAWWFERDVIKRINPNDIAPVWPGSYKPSDDFAVANIGQAKAIADKAHDELNALVPGGTGASIDALVDPWSKPAAPGAPARDGFAGIVLGQMKAVSKPFHDRLMQIGFSSSYPWTPTPVDDDSYALGNIGQLKRLFSFDFSRDRDGDGLSDGEELFIYRSNPSAPSPDAARDTDGDGFPDWWEIANKMNPAIANAKTADWDGDGFSDWDEFRGATNPRRSSDSRRAQVTIFSGEEQLGLSGHTLPQPLVALVKDSAGRTLQGVPITFEVVENHGWLSQSVTGARSKRLDLVTEGSGKAQVWFTLPGEFHVHPAVHAWAGSGAVLFTATRSLNLPPVAPTAVTARYLNENHTRIRWRDASTDEAAFVIERSLNRDDWEVVASLPPNSVEYIATSSGSAGLPYLYRVISSYTQ